MRLFTRNGIYYVEFSRSDKRSLRTSNESEAKAAFRKLRKAWLEGRLISLEAESSITIGEFVPEYLKSRTALSPKTRYQDEFVLRKFAEIAGEQTPLKLIDTRKLEEFKQVCLSMGLGKHPRPNKPSAVNSYLSQVRSALSTAVEWGYLKSRPTLKPIRTGKQLPRYLKPEQIQPLLSKAAELHPGFELMLVFYLWTGARRNEALALTWPDVRLDGKNPQVLLTGKGNRQRIVPLTPALVDMLTPIRKDYGHVFMQIHESTLTHWFKDVARECGIDARLHDLRHSAATYMLANGIPIRMVQEILGHADIATTAIYAEVIKEHLHREMKKLRFEFD